MKRNLVPNIVLMLPSVFKAVIIALLYLLNMSHVLKYQECFKVVIRLFKDLYLLSFLEKPCTNLGKRSYSGARMAMF